MKLFYEEEKIEKVCVQNKDLLYIKNVEVPVPAELFSTLFLEEIDHLKKDPNGYATFVETEIISFFKEAECILDYQEVKHYSPEKLKEKQKQLFFDIQKLLQTKPTGPASFMVKRDLKRMFTQKKYLLDTYQNLTLLRAGKVDPLFQNEIKKAKIKKYSTYTYKTTE